MANQNAIQQGARKQLREQWQLVTVGQLPTSVEEASSWPANDNPVMPRVPTCLPVTEDEVKLLHRYLSREILGLFS